MFMVLSSWQSHCQSSPGSFDECRTPPSGRRPKTKQDDLGCTGCQSLHPPSPFIIITQAESWYSFYHPTEGRRLSRPSSLVSYGGGLPVHRRSLILVLTGSDVDRGHGVTTKPNRQPPKSIYLTASYSVLRFHVSIDWVSLLEGWWFVQLTTHLHSARYGVIIFQFNMSVFAQCYAQHGLCCRKMSVCLPVCPSVRLSVCLSVTASHAAIMSKRLNMLSWVTWRNIQWHAMLRVIMTLSIARSFCDVWASCLLSSLVV